MLLSGHGAESFFFYLSVNEAFGKWRRTIEEWLQVSLLYTNDGGNFTLVEDTPFMGLAGGDVAFSDVDGDGDDDVLITGHSFNSPYSKMYVNEGGIFSEATSLTGVRDGSIAFSDIDGDGDEDIVITGVNSSSDEICKLYENVTPQVDTDGDGISNANDNCVELPNADQTDTDGDGLGDICDACPNDPDNDADQDGICDDVDDCVGVIDSVGVCNGACFSPFPGVDEFGLNTTFQGSSYLIEWDTLPGQVACQVELASQAGLIKRAILYNESAGSAVIPGSLLYYSTTYAWRVRCGCSLNPLIVGPFSSWQIFTTPAGAVLSSHPNPTEGQSAVNFSVNEESYTTLEVFDLSGRKIDVLFAGVAEAKSDYRFTFDGSALPNGIYLYRLTTNGEVIHEKFMISR